MVLEMEQEMAPRTERDREHMARFRASIREAVSAGQGELKRAFEEEEMDL